MDSVNRLLASPAFPESTTRTHDRSSQHLPAGLGAGRGDRPDPADFRRQAQSISHPASHLPFACHGRGNAVGTVIHSFETGLGATLGHIAIVVALGTMLGKDDGRVRRRRPDRSHADPSLRREARPLGHDGDRPHRRPACVFRSRLRAPHSDRLHRRAPHRNLPAARRPADGRRDSRSFTGWCRRTPQPCWRSRSYKADVGRTIFYALLIGIPTAVLAGPLYAKFIAPHIDLAAENPMADDFVDHGAERSLPGFGLTSPPSCCRSFLMLIGSWADACRRRVGLNQALRLLGNDDMALLIGVLSVSSRLGKMRRLYARDHPALQQRVPRAHRYHHAAGRRRRRIRPSPAGQRRLPRQSFIARCRQPCAAALAGVAAGRAHAPRHRLGNRRHDHRRRNRCSHRAAHRRGPRPELLAIATGAGSLIFSHVNDGGFWLVKEYLNLSVTQTMKTWSICETIISVTALVFALAASFVV